MANSVTNKWVIRQNINCHISMIPFFDRRTLSCFTVNMKFFFSFLCPFSPVLKLFSDQKSLFSFSGFVCFFTGANQFMWQLSERLCNCFSACAICFWVWISISTATCSCLEYSQFCLSMDEVFLEVSAAKSLCEITFLREKKPKNHWEKNEIHMFVERSFLSELTSTYTTLMSLSKVMLILQFGYYLYAMTL